MEAGHASAFAGTPEHERPGRIRARNHFADHLVALPGQSGLWI
jgi:hypothetical protein